MESMKCGVRKRYSDLYKPLCYMKYQVSGGKPRDRKMEQLVPSSPGLPMWQPRAGALPYPHWDGFCHPQARSSRSASQSLLTGILGPLGHMVVFALVNQTKPEIKKNLLSMFKIVAIPLKLGFGRCRLVSGWARIPASFSTVAWDLTCSLAAPWTLHDRCVSLWS